MLLPKVEEPSDPGVAGRDSFASSVFVSGETVALPDDVPPLSFAFRLVLALLFPRLMPSEFGFSSTSSAGVELRDDCLEWLLESVRRNDRRLVAALASFSDDDNGGRSCA